ncbi:MAG TPA: nuclear transport factor 2 family protein [Solirubrobacteraceae bacterium]|nr:nuclear transport factor 2 family protein [Solirubrobacteraceae bacterium]
MSTGVPDGFERFAHIQEIKDLALRYALYIDTRDLEPFPDLWTPADEPAPPPELNGATFRDGVDRFFRSSTASVHLVANHLVTLHDDRHASGTVYCWAQTDRTSAWVSQMVLYQDRYLRCEDDRWRFETRRHLLWYGLPAPVHPRQQEPMVWPGGDIHGNGSFGRGSLPEGFPTYRAFWGLEPGESVDGAPTSEGEAR